MSEDSGETWSADTVLRDDAPCGDLGYPVTMELDDGRILTVYYYNLDDGNQFGGTRFIAGTFFRLA
ncbi:MAG: exo-alpha-sialidase [Chloroflexi bacterium]|nr:exo-alpha-sialidase [Chloroflexota bacterium]